MSLWPCCFRLVLLALVLVDESASKCRDGYYYAFHQKRCRRCSTNCAEEYIVLPCSEFADVICEMPHSSREFHFTEFEGGARHHQLQPHVSGAGVPNHSGNSHSVSLEESSSEDELELTMEENHDWKNWKVLAFVLKAVLCLLIVVAMVVGVVACFKVQQALVQKQNEEPDIDDADSGYVVIRTIRDDAGPHRTYSDHSLFLKEERLAHPPLLTSQDTGLGSSDAPSSFSLPGQSLCYLPKVYTPQRRLLTYDADDVFESDDQTCSQTLPQRPSQFSSNKSFFYNLHSHKDRSRKKKKKALKSNVKRTSSVSGVSCWGKRYKDEVDAKIDFV